MSPNRTGFTPLVVTSLVFGGIAIITHITAVAYPEWDGIDAKWHPVPNVSLSLPIQAHGSLWDFAVVIDRSNILSPYSKIHRHRQVTIESSEFVFNLFNLCVLTLDL